LNFILELKIPLNKFEKCDLVIKLHKEGKTYREIAHIAHISPRDIKLIIKKYEQQKRLETKKGETNNQKTKKPPSLSTQAFIHYQKGKQIDEVKVLLDIPFKKAKTFWEQYLESIRMEDCYQFYEVFQNDLSTLLPISNFMKRNSISEIDILNVLRTANDVITLNQTYSNLKTEIERLEQMKNNYSLNQNTNNQPLLPLGLPKYYYEQL
jgi:hypothetical protein